MRIDVGNRDQYGRTHFRRDRDGVERELVDRHRHAGPSLRQQGEIGALDRGVGLRDLGETRLIERREATRSQLEELGRRKPDTTAIRELTGWRPELTVDDAIKDVVTFERQRQGGSPLAA